MWAESKHAKIPQKIFHLELKVHGLGWLCFASLNCMCGSEPNIVLPPPWWFRAQGAWVQCLLSWMMIQLIIIWTILIGAMGHVTDQSTQGSCPLSVTLWTCLVSCFGVTFRWTSGKKDEMKSSSAYPHHFGLAVRKCQSLWLEVKDSKEEDPQVQATLEEWADWMVANLPPPGTLAQNEPLGQYN